jgi:two-component system response regulator NreC
VEAFRAGAMGYVLKDSAPGEVIRAVHEALRGSKYLSPKLPEGLAETSVETTQKAPLDSYESLTSREREVFQLAAEGKTAAEIAGVLCISPRTAELHRGRVLSKLGVRNQSELVRYAVRRGVLPLDC